MNNQSAINPKIDEIVSFLSKYAPADLKKIRAENSEYAAILEDGEILGEGDEAEMKARAEACIVATAKVIELCEERFPKIRKRLKSNQQLTLWGQIVTTISGASVITALAADFTAVTYVAGGLGLLGSLIPLIATRQNQGVADNIKLNETYVDLVRFQVEAQIAYNELKVFTSHGFNMEGVAEVIKRTNQLCQEIMIKLQLSI